MKINRYSAVAILLVFVGALALSGCTTISGEVIDEKRDIEEFDQISLEGFGKLLVTQGDDTELEISAREGLMDRIRTRVSGNTLHISYKRTSFIRGSLGPAEYRITTPELSSVEISGSGSLEMSELNTDQFRFETNGSGKAEIDAMTADALSIKVDGSGKFIAAGRADDIELTINGSGNYQGAELEGKNADISINGSGKTEVNASDRLEINISGSGTVEYTGNPRIDQSVSGSGTVRNIDK